MSFCFGAQLTELLRNGADQPLKQAAQQSDACGRLPLQTIRQTDGNKAGGLRNHAPIPYPRGTVFAFGDWIAELLRNELQPYGCVN